MTIYEVFEFRDGKSVKSTEGPLMHIRVNEGEDKHDVLKAVGLPGNTFGYGLREITDLAVERKALATAYKKATVLLDTFNYITS